MIKTFTIICALIFMLTGCQGCFLPGIGQQKVGPNFTELNKVKPVKTAVIVPLWGTVSEEWAIDVEKALKNPKNDLIVLKIESPGGSVSETILLLRKISFYQKKYNKQICIYSEKLLASGAYWVASTFKPVIMSPIGYAGSIGVYIERTDYSERLKKLGIRIYLIASDSTKISGHSSVPMNEKTLKNLQKSVNNTHRLFMQYIWHYRAPQLISAYKTRNWPFGKVKTFQDTILVQQQFRQIANGSVYPAQEALKYGLVDGVVFFDTFIKNLQMKGYTTVLLNGQLIKDFYPMTEHEWIEKQKVTKYIKERLQVKK